jgi:hypothetical protein
MKKIIFLLLILVGSFKINAAIIYVNATATGANNGTSWTDAYTDLQTALSVAFINDDIWVASGIYKPTQTTTRTISFVMKNGVDMFGGFNGTETNISQRDITANPTYLSGDIGTLGDNTDNTYKVVKIQNFTTPFTFDGFRVVSGYDATSSGSGAGMYIFNNPGINLSLKNTIVYNNYAYHSGGGLIIDNSTTTFNNCEFLYNSSYNYGGGAIYSANSSNSYIYLTDCKFIGNNSRQGPVINFDGEELVMERNIISSNTSTISGNIINVSNGPTRFEINNSLIVGNQVADGGGSVVTSYTSGVNSSSITNSTICHNKNTSSTTVYAEAISQSNSAMLISNCIIYGNTNSDMNVQIDPGNTVRNSIVENGYSTGVNVNTTNPMFVNPGMLAMAPFDVTSFDYALVDGSPAVNFGDNTYAQNFTVDLFNNARIQQFTVDCGAIESPFADTQLPTALCNNVTLPLNSTGTASLTTAQVNNNSTDNVGIVSYTLSETNFNCSQLGANSVILTVSDASGNSNTCVSTVTVVDVTSPTILTQDLSVYLDATGQATISTAEIDNGTWDNCGLDTLFLSNYTFTCNNSGNNVVSFTAIDLSGNSISGNVNVLVIDSVFPQAIAQNKTIYLNANGTATLNASQVNNGSLDDCGIASMSLSQTNYNCTDIGPNTVNFSVMDFYGNTTSIPVQITVLDTIKPVTIGQSLTVNLSVSNPANISASQINNGSHDNCSFTQSVSPSSFTAAGTYSVVLTSTDASGNTSSGTYMVTVIDQSTNGINDEVTKNRFKLFPNPTNDIVHVQTMLEEQEIECSIKDIAGKLIATYYYPNTTTFDVKLAGSAGIYFLEIRTASGFFNQFKLIKE